MASDEATIRVEVELASIKKDLENYDKQLKKNDTVTEKLADMVSATNVAFQTFMATVTERLNTIEEKVDTIKNKKPFIETPTGRFLLIFGVAVIVGLLVVSTGINLQNMSDVKKVLGD